MIQLMILIQSLCTLGSSIKKMLWNIQPDRGTLGSSKIAVFEEIFIRIFP